MQSRPACPLSFFPRRDESINHPSQCPPKAKISPNSLARLAKQAHCKLRTLFFFLFPRQEYFSHHLLTFFHPPLILSQSVYNTRSIFRISSPPSQRGFWQLRWIHELPFPKRQHTAFQSLRVKLNSFLPERYISRPENLARWLTCTF